MVALSPRYYPRMENPPFRRFKLDGRRGWYVLEEEVVAYIDKAREVCPQRDKLFETLSAWRREVEAR